MTAFAVPGDAEGRLTGAAVKQVKEMIVQAAPPATGVDPGVLHAATCDYLESVTFTLRNQGTGETSSGKLDIYRVGLQVNVTSSVDFPMAGKPLGAGAVFDVKFPTPPVYLPGHPITPGDGVVDDVFYGTDADNAASVKYPGIGDAILQAARDAVGRLEVWSAAFPDGGATIIRKMLAGKTVLVADPAPPGSY